MFNIRSAQKQDIDGILKVSSEVFGETFITEKDLLEMLSLRKSVLNVALFNSKVIGFCFIKKYSPQEVYENTILRQYYSREVGIIKTIAISSKFQRRGYGVELLTKTLEVFSQYKVDVLISFAWREKGNINSEKVLNHVGLKSIRQFSCLWYEDSIKTGFICKTCGNPCRCDAILFEKSMD